MSFQNRFDNKCTSAMAAAIVGTIAVSVPSTAWAQDGQPVSPETPAAPAPAPATAPPASAPASGIAAEKGPMSSGDETHERRGWYVAAGLGGGGLVGSNINKDGDSRSASLSSGTVNLNVAVGRGLSRGLALGAELYVMGAVGPSASFPSGASLSTGSLSLIGIGPFVDYYFDASKGWHVQAAAGYGLLMGPSSCTDSGSCTPSNDLFADMSGSALSISAGIGHDWWIGPGFSLGVLARAGYTTGSMSNPANFKLDVQAPVLALEITGSMGK